MKLHWKILWMTLGILPGLVLVGGCVVSLYRKSLGVFYQTIKLAFVVGFGVCGLAALIAVSIAIFIRKNTEDSP